MLPSTLPYSHQETQDSCKQLWIRLPVLVPAGQHLTSSFEGTHALAFPLTLCGFPFWSPKEAHNEKVAQSRFLFDSERHETPYTKPDVQVMVWVLGYPDQCRDSSFWIGKVANHGWGGKL